MKVLLTLLMFLMSGTTYADKAAENEFSYGIAITTLIAHPERFDGKSVILMGYLKIRDSYSALFISRADLDDGLTLNSIGIVNDGNEQLLRPQNDGKPVLIEALFKANPPEPALGYATSGRLVKVRSLSPLLKSSQ